MSGLRNYHIVLLLQEIKKKNEIGAVIIMEMLFEVDETENIEQFEKNLETIKAISKLEKNWNFYGADAFPGSFVRWVRIVLMNIDIQPQVYPTAANSVQFEFEREDGAYLQFELHIKKSVSMYCDWGRPINDESITLPFFRVEDISETVDLFYGNRTFADFCKALEEQGLLANEGMRQDNENQ